MKSILNCVPEHIKLREIQEAFGRFMEENYDTHDVFVIGADVGSGKSWMAMMLANWVNEVHNKNVALTVPTKMLQKQYQDVFADVPLFKGMNNYKCNAVTEGTCKNTYTITGMCCKNNCTYQDARTEAKAAPVAIFNLHVYFNAKMHKTLFISDEAHNIAPTVYSLYGTNIWGCEEDTNELPEDPNKIVEFLNNRIMHYSSQRQMAIENLNQDLADKLDAKIDLFNNITALLLNEDAKNIIIKKKKDIYRGFASEESRNTMQEYLFIKPINISKLAEKLFWPQGSVVEKIILLSATINEVDIDLLGLNNKKVCYFNYKSPIPPDRRPFIVWPIANMSYKTRKTDLEKLIKGIIRVADANPEKGIIHCTYETAEKLKLAIGHDGRYIFHNKRNKEDQYNYFRETKENKILVASGMSEGIDLPDDAARWQIITQVMYPSLQDEVNVWRINNKPDLYAWDTVKTIRQQTGRVCRSQEDFGKTYMLDTQFLNLWYRTHTERIKLGKSSLWSDSFVESIIWPKK